MTYNVRCRVCGEYIGLMGWNKHVEKHKREYCRKMKILEKNYRSIDWEKVVDLFNPKESRQKVLIPKTNNLDDW